MRIQRIPNLAFYGLIYAVSWAIYGAVSWPHTHPPYMDSYYYVDIARNIARGRGLTEGFVWNYLGGMPRIPHASSEYWLPAMSLLLAPVWALGGYHGAALLTAAVAALCPALAAKIGSDIFGRRGQALTMACLTLFNGLWFHDWSTPDAFVPFAALATVTLMLASRGLQGRVGCFVLAGLTAGLAALVRQEGALLLAAVILSAILTPATRRILWPGSVLGAGVLFGLAQAPWIWHNLAVIGAPFAAGGSRTLWMRSYDAFFSLHTDALTPRAYAAWGIANLAGARLNAALFTLAVWSAQWIVVLAPPLLAGLWRLRRRLECRPFLVYWVLLALAMPLLFTVTLDHGTLPHASAALVPFGSAFVVDGLQVLGSLLARLRGQHGARLARDMSIMAVGLAALVSLGMTWRTSGAQGDEYARDTRVVAWLHHHNRPEAPVMVLDPPAFAYLDDTPYVVAPSDGLGAVLAVARHYKVRYWALDPLHAAAQDSVYTGRVLLSWARRVASVDGVEIYEMTAARSRQPRRRG